MKSNSYSDPAARVIFRAQQNNADAETRSIVLSAFFYDNGLTTSLWYLTFTVLVRMRKEEKLFKQWCINYLSVYAGEPFHSCRNCAF